MTKAEYINNQKCLASLPVFYQPWYLDIFGIDWDIFEFKIDNTNWIFPYFKEKKWFFKLNRPPLFTPYYGPIPISSEFENVSINLKNISSLIKFSNQFSNIVFTPKYEFDFSDLAKYGFDLIPKVTHIINLKQSEEDLWNKVDNKVRRNIKKASDSIKIIEGEFNANLYIDWLIATVKKRNDKLIFEEVLVRKYIETIIANNAAIVATAYDNENNILGMNLCLKDEQVAYNILLVNNPSIKNNLVATRLLWNAIFKAKTLGCHTFDFEGSNIKGVADFFRRFGSEKITFNGLKKTNSLLWKLKNKILK